MKTGRTLSELAAELERQAGAKKDYIADTRKLQMVPLDTGKVKLNGVNGGMELKPIAHGQLSAALGIPKVYYDRMLEQAPDLLSANVNAWFERQPAKKLVRAMDNQVRAILSDSYRPLDNLDLAMAVLPKLVALEAKVVSSEVTDSRLYLKAISEKIQGEIKVGDVIQAGLVVSNSEVGAGALKVEEMDYRLVCTNGMIRDVAVRKAHLSRAARGADAIEDAREFFRSETRIADDRAFFMKVEDTVASMFSQSKLAKRLELYREASTVVLSAAPEDVVEVTAKRFALNDTERSAILRHLIKGDDASVWGLANAITRTAQDSESYDRATELEALGGAVVELPRSIWKNIGLLEAKTVAV